MMLRRGGPPPGFWCRGGGDVRRAAVTGGHGSVPAISPWPQLWTTLIRSTRIENAIRNDEMVMITFVVAHAGLAYVQMRRGMPSSPSVCMIRKVPLKPTNTVQKFHSPRVRLSRRPVILGNQ